MLIRALFPKHKDIMLINDVPVKGELAPRTKEDTYGDKFSAISNLGMLTAFRKGALDVYSKQTELPGITQKDIFTTYLDYSYYGEDEVEKNFDFCKEFRKRKELDPVENEVYLKDIEGNLFYKLEHQKDVYIASRLWEQLQALLEEIRIVQPKFIITTGKWGLFFLTGCSTLTSNQGKPGEPKPLGALSKFRSSILPIHETFGTFHEHVLIPIYHTINAMTMPDKAYIMDLDIQKVCWMYQQSKSLGIGYYIRPDKEYIIGNTKEKALSYLNELLNKFKLAPTLVSIDIETFFMSTIDCIGFAYESNRGCCIPFASKDKASLWSIEDEVEVVTKIREVLTHPNCLHVGQNYQYDCQYFYKLWNIDVRPTHDTMVLHHLLHNKLPKDLAFLASLYCEVYSYWKGERDGTKENPETRWIYNAKDCCYTLEVLEVLLDILESTDDKELKELYSFQIDDLHPELVTTMNRGVRVNKDMKDSLHSFFKAMLDQVPDKINELLGFNFNANSTQQKKKLFKDFFGLTLKTNKKKGVGEVETCDAKAMLAYMEEEPLLKPFLGVLLEFSALGKFTTTFLGMKLDNDDKARTQYRITGTAFGRLASTKNVWGNGGNLQNLPEKGKLPIHYLLNLVQGSSTDDSAEDSLEFIEAMEDNFGADYE